MASGTYPDALDERGILIAHLIAAGVPNVRIAELVGLSANRLSLIRQSPAMRAVLPQVQREIREQLTADVAQRLSAETGPTLTRLCALRDQEGHLPTALGAANALFDRQVPKVTIADVRNEHVIRFDGAFLGRAQAALAEMGEAIDVEAVPAPMPRGAMLAAVEADDE